MKKEKTFFGYFIVGLIGLFTVFLLNILFTFDVIRLKQDLRLNFIFIVYWGLPYMIYKGKISALVENIYFVFGIILTYAVLKASVL
jgi:uncharacterized membrane protein (GlpM family)